MYKIKTVLCLFSILTLFSCNRTDFSNPEDVIKNYRRLRNENNNNEVLYDDYISTKSKEFVTKDEFIKDLNRSDSTLKTSKNISTKILNFPVDINKPSYRRFKVDETELVKNDTVFSRLYYTLINENGKWKVIWTNTLQSFAWQKYNDGNYSEARGTLEKLIEFDPYNGEIYDKLAWCYFRDESLSSVEMENGFVSNAKYAINLEQDNPWRYITLATYYSSTGNIDLSIENEERGLQLCLNKVDKTMFYSNLASDYIYIKKYEKATEYINKSIMIDKNDAFVWYNYGRLMMLQNNYKRSIEYYKTALSLPKMENFLQGRLYYEYADCSFKIGNCSEARDYINKALDIDPSSSMYQSLYSRLIKCK